MAEVLRGSSEAIRGNQRHSELLRGHPRSSEGPPRSSEIIRGLTWARVEKSGSESEYALSDGSSVVSSSVERKAVSTALLSDSCDLSPAEAW